MNNLAINNKDLTIMKLIHYFVTEENYNPIVLKGIDNEIWLENLESPYKVVRIVNHYIHNNEQLSYDNMKVNQITSRLKKKTLSVSMKVLSLYTDLGDNVNLLSNKNFENVSLKKISDIKKSNAIEIFPNIIEKTTHEEKGIELFAKITSDINEKNKEKSQKLDRIFRIKKPVITYGIIGICIFMFILMYIFGSGSTDNYTLIRFGANLGILTKSGEYFRLLTCAFLHIGVLHLVFNMYALYIIGSQIENFFGKWKYITIYLISAISASILSMAFNNSVISAGASGAIFGLLGSMLYFGYHYRVFLGNVIKSQILPIIIVNLALGFMLTGVDNAAHIGGLIAGVLTSMALRIKDKTAKSDSINGTIVLIIYLAFITYLAFFI